MAPTCGFGPASTSGPRFAPVPTATTAKWFKRLDAMDRVTINRCPHLDVQTSSRVIVRCHHGFATGGYLRPPTALAMTSKETMRAEMAWMLIRSLARLDNGMVSVGLNAELLVTDT